MKTKYKIEGLDPKLCKDPGKLSVVAAALSKKEKERAREQFLLARHKYTARSQPRNTDGKFRKILARLKADLGDSELREINKQINAAEKASVAGDYVKATKAAREVIGLVDDIEQGKLEPEIEKNLRKGTADLGRVLAYLPLPQGTDSEKVRFSDLPPSTGRFIQDVIKRIEDQINKKDAAKFTRVLNSFLSGGRTMSSDQLSAELNKLLRLLS